MINLKVPGRGKSCLSERGMSVATEIGNKKKKKRKNLLNGASLLSFSLSICGERNKDLARSLVTEMTLRREPRTKDWDVMGRDRTGPQRKERKGTAQRQPTDRQLIKTEK